MLRTPALLRRLTLRPLRSRLRDLRSPPSDSERANEVCDSILYRVLLYYVVINRDSVLR